MYPAKIGRCNELQIVCLSLWSFLSSSIIILPMNLDLAHILYPMIISSLSPFTLSSCLLSYCSALHLPFCSCCFIMRWMNGLTSHCTENTLTLLSISRGLCSFPCVLHVDIQIHNLAELKLGLLFWGSRMCIFTLLLDCSAETNHQLVVDVAISNSMSTTPYNKLYPTRWNWVTSAHTSTSGC